MRIVVADTSRDLNPKDFDLTLFLVYKVISKSKGMFNLLHIPPTDIMKTVIVFKSYPAGYIFAYHFQMVVGKRWL